MIEEDLIKIDEVSVKIVQGFGYNMEEAINILNGKNPDGSDTFNQLPF